MAKTMKRGAPRPAAKKPSRVAVRTHERAKPQRKAEPPPLGAGHAVESLRRAFPELGG